MLSFLFTSPFTFGRIVLDSIITRYLIADVLIHDLENDWINVVWRISQFTWSASFKEIILYTSILSKEITTKALFNIIQYLKLNFHSSVIDHLPVKLMLPEIVNGIWQ